MPEKVKIENIEFPLGGVDRTGELHEQLPGTTYDAANVRGVNPDSLRERGGTRAGLIRYIPGPLFAGADVIQHLNVIVDPQAAALQQTFLVPGDDWVEDPLNPGFFIPPGGWGYQPNPNSPPPSPPTTGTIAGSFTAGVAAEVGCTGGGPNPQPAGAFLFTGVPVGSQNLTFQITEFPPTEQIDYAAIVVGSAGGTVVNNGAFSAEIDGVVITTGLNATGYVVPTKPFP